ncbi:hypothetical protein KDN32_14385 [Nocardioides sp. J2M5]|uniref:hypothetical protein n=1 Tax=Nocardioides palaemonis TaxID=2829810 RepID=UPI001BA58CC0|nr:hypothetical protein [Nocardioides palaemonis]MBS2938925.1 hypothetical protein [Nocardioides palaemonis]
MELATWLSFDPPGDWGSVETDLLDEPPRAINWATLTAEEAKVAWRELDAWVSWLKNAYGLSPAVVPPLWHRHDELVWELSGLHTHWLSCHDETAPPSAPLAWLRDFADARNRLQDWVAVCGTRLDRDRPTRRTSWPGESDDATTGEVEISDRERDFDAYVDQDLRRRRRVREVRTPAGTS